MNLLTGDGSTTTFAVPFPYLERDHVFLSVNDVAATFTWLNDGNIVADAVPASGTTVKVYRKTPQEPLSLLKSNSPNRDSVYNRLTLQALYLSQESRDSGDYLGGLYADFETVMDGILASAQSAETGAVGAKDTAVVAKTDAQNAKTAAESAAGANLSLQDTRAAAALTNIPASVQKVITAGFAAPDDGGGATYYKKPAPEVDRPGDFTSADGARWGLAKQFFNIRMFGALPSVANNRQAIQDALDFTKLVSNQMHIPSGRYKYTLMTTNVLLFQGLGQITGDGRNASILEFAIDGSNGGDTTFIDGLRINPQTQDYVNFNGSTYRDFAVEPAVAGTGRNAIRIVLAATSFMANFLMDGVRGGDVAKQGIHFDNSVDNLDGFFVGRVRNCVSINGFGGIKVGDSIAFYDCQGPAGTVCTTASWDITGVPGARQYLFIGHSNTSRAGAAKLVGVDQARYMFNQNEHSWWTGDGAYTGDTDALISFKDCLQPWIVGNTGNPFHNYERTIASAVAMHVDSGSTTMTMLYGVPVPSAIQVGDKIVGGGIPAGSTVTAKTTTTITSSAAATVTTDNTFNFTRIVNPNGAAYTCLIGGTTNMAIVEYNDFAKGRIASVGIEAGAKNTYLGLNHHYGDVNPVITDSGQGTMGTLRTVSTFLNGWSAAGTGPFRYTKTGDKMVHLEGAVVHGTGIAALNNLFTLPTGYRPPASRVFHVMGAASGADVTCKVMVGADGVVSVIPLNGATSVTRVYLDGIAFHAALVA